MAEEEENRRSSQPLSGSIICCTSIPPEQRSELASQAEQMGAVHKLDLTSDVTHLIVGDSSTPKYKYVARERPDVKILTPGWIEAVRQLWIHFQDIDLHALEERHRLPVFAGLRICLTGIEESTERARFQKLIVANGAEYHGDLTKTVTHLLAYKAEGEKFRHANMWGLKIVSLEWLMDSLERGMILEEAMYNPLTPQEERGKNAWIRKMSSTTLLGKRPSSNGQPASNYGEDGTSRRKLRRTTSSKLQSQNSSIWGDIVGGGFEQSSRGGETWGNGLTDGQNDKEPVKLASESGAERIAQTAEKAREQDENRTRRENGNEQSRNCEADKHGLFSDKHFYLHGFDNRQTRILQSHIISQDGHVSLSFSDISQSTPENQSQDAYIIVPHNYQKIQDLIFPHASRQPVIASEWWIEKCLYCKRISDPRGHVLARPFSRYPLPDFERVTICSTAFSGVDLLHVSRVVKLMGAKFDEFLTPNASVLVCSSPLQNTEKLTHAVDWNIPCVSSKWLWDSIEREVKMAFNDYLVRGSEIEDRPSTLPLLQRTPDGVEDPRRCKSDASKLKSTVVKAQKGSFPRKSVLHGCGVSVSRLFKNEQRKLRDMARSLGATIVDIHPENTDRGVTHFIYIPSDSEQVPDEYRLAADIPGCQIVSSDWLYQCTKDKVRLDEKPYLCKETSEKSPDAQPADSQTKKTAQKESAPDKTKDNAIPSPSNNKTEDQILPLQDIEPEVNSSRQRPSNEAQTNNTRDESKLQPSKPSIPATEDLNNAIASLLARKQGAFTSTTSSTTNNETTTATLNGRRKGPPPRLQGRASNTLSSALSRGNSAEYGDMDNALEHNEQAEPSQRVLYEDPEVREHRERVVRKMGGKVETTGPKKPRSIGVVKDMGGIGTRTRLRTGLGL